MALRRTDCAFYLGEKSLYDSAVIGAAVSGYPGSGLSLPGGVSAVYSIGARWIPLLDPVLVRLRPVPLRKTAIDSARIEKAHRFRYRSASSWSASTGGRKGRAATRMAGRLGLRPIFASLVTSSCCAMTAFAPVITPIGPLEGADLGHAARIAFNY
jgi:hypothetical protein